tara:strand:- start:779 stop:1210 length:432 start_codon:yes stop_codon:yes gene_type:complete
MITNFIVEPVRLIDGGHIELQRRFQLNLAKLFPDDQLAECFKAPLTRQITLKLFNPPQREEFRNPVVTRRNQGEKEHEVAIALNITQTAVQRAAALQRRWMPEELMNHLRWSQSLRRITRNFAGTNTHDTGLNRYQILSNTLK